MQHPDEGRLHEYADGALAPAETAALERHLAECEACRAALGEVHALLGESDRLVAKLQLDPPLAPPRPVGPRAARPWWQSRTLGLAASALLVVGLGWIAVGRGVATREVTDGASAPAATESEPSAATAAKSAPDSTLAQRGPDMPARSADRTGSGVPRPPARDEVANAAREAESKELAATEPQRSADAARLAAPAPAAPTASARAPMAMRADTPPSGEARERVEGAPLNDLPRWKPQVAAEAPAAGVAPRYVIAGLQAVSHEPLPGGGTRSVYSVDGARVELEQGPGAAPARPERSAQYEVSWELDGTKLTLRAALTPAQVEELRARVR